MSNWNSFYGEPFTGRGYFLERFNGSPVIFLVFALGETASPERSIGECGGGKISPKAKASENKGLKCESAKKFLLPVNAHCRYRWPIIYGLC